MRKNYTILFPQMAPIHFELLETAVRACGYNLELLRDCTQHTVETGLKYVNNDACYPSILVTGQMIEALQSSICFNSFSVEARLLDPFNPPGQNTASGRVLSYFSKYSSKLISAMTGIL